MTQNEDTEQSFSRFSPQKHKGEKLFEEKEKSSKANRMKWTFKAHFMILHKLENGKEQTQDKLFWCNKDYLKLN